MEYLIESINTPLNQLTMFQWVIVILFVLVVVSLVMSILALYIYLIVKGWIDR